MGPRLEVSPAAKINLDLRVLGRRPDGYHEIRTLYQSIDLRDHLTAEAAPAGEFTLDVAPRGAVDPGGDNLVLRAARLIADHTRIRRGARFCLCKKIPVGGGLGGGSADAAAALILLDRLWDCRLDDGVLRRLAAELGSDVPFFLHGGLALGIGRGDEVEELPDQDEMPVVVTVPGVRVPTAEVYVRQSRQLTSHRPEGTLYAFAADPRGRLDFRAMTNELENVVVGSWPEVGEGLRKLRSCAPLYASLSGSGAASFAVFESTEAARRAAATLPANWFVHLGTTLRRSRARLEVDWNDGGRG